MQPPRGCIFLRTGASFAPLRIARARGIWYNQCGKFQRKEVIRMNEILQREFLVDSRDTDLHGLCRPSALLGYLQEMATEHSEVLGISRRVMLERHNCVWLLARLWYRLETPILRDQTLTVRTWTRGASGATSYRDFDLFVGDERVGEAVTSWVLADVDDRSIRRMSRMEEVVNAAVPACVKERSLSRFPMPKDLTELMTRRVYYSDTDINGHMNNTRYVDVACDAVRFDGMRGSFLAEVMVNYSRECLPGSELHILGKCEGETWFVRGADEADAAHFDTALRFAPIPCENDGFSC